MRQGIAAGAFGLVVVLFCLPLFTGLGRPDLGNDEAIYSFAVDRMVEDGEWLVPKSSPNAHIPFFEKPPLKFWIVAAPLAAGLLPRDEFGLRFWDAVFGSIAFVYVFAIGGRLGGLLCGLVAVLALFVHRPLLFDHGLRSNNMEAALLLSYCGGVFHYLSWLGAPAASAAAWRHALAVAVFFVLGFMTKFVAALFLPFVLVVATLLLSPARTRAWAERRTWAFAAALAGVLTVPWFVVQHLMFGGAFWASLVGDHVYTRFTEYADPAHVQPWSFYFVELHRTLAASGVLPLAILGGLLLAATILVTGSAAAVVTLLWFAVPMAAISVGTSKLYHYAYPFLPPVALAAGLGPGLAWRFLHPRIVRAGATLDAVWEANVSARWRVLRSRAVRAALLGLAMLAAAVAIATALAGPLRVRIADVVVRNASVERPIVVTAVLGLLASGAGIVWRLIVPMLILAVLPVGAYRETLGRLTIARHPIRDTRDCVIHVIRARQSHRPPGVYTQGIDEVYEHQYFYYFSAFGPWEWDAADDDRLREAIWGAGADRPVLVGDARYRELRSRARAAGTAAPSPPMVSFGNLLLILPGDLAACSDDARAPGLRS